MNKEKFYESIKYGLFNGRFSQKQVDGFELILTATAHLDKRYVAYMLATVYHETGRTMQPIEEREKGRGRRYSGKVKMDGTAYLFPNKIYYGRGYVQLTWYDNYKKMGKLLGIDLLNNPELALVHEVSIKILIEGMTKAESNFGDFTGKCLEQYINDKKCDYVGCRGIINGKD
ncbi:MAG: glycoside hydrolase family 19 protein, partial [Daejeonella sp.]